MEDIHGLTSRKVIDSDGEHLPFLSGDAAATTMPSSEFMALPHLLLKAENRCQDSFWKLLPFVPAVACSCLKSYPLKRSCIMHPHGPLDHLPLAPLCPCSFAEPSAEKDRAPPVLGCMDRTDDVPKPWLKGGAWQRSLTLRIG